MSDEMIEKTEQVIVPHERRKVGKWGERGLMIGLPGLWTETYKVIAGDDLDIFIEPITGILKIHPPQKADSGDSE